MKKNKRVFVLQPFSPQFDAAFQLIAAVPAEGVARLERTGPLCCCVGACGHRDH